MSNDNFDDDDYDVAAVDLDDVAAKIVGQLKCSLEERSQLKVCLVKKCLNDNFGFWVKFDFNLN